LNQYFGMQQILPQLENKTAVYVVSPQWFTKKGYDASAFQQYFNSDQLTSFLKQQNGDIAAQYAAKRLLQLYPNVAMKDNVKKLAEKKSLTSFDQSFIRFMARINQREDAFFSTFVAANNENYENLVLPKLKNLPSKFSYPALEKVGVEEAQKHT
ncbi:D-alanyl-lipoteichoic acid biosynthesis protein DltD, partial [Escherichia coli]|nr:D-alanyl-lipoteichoic acid biosynthesis protein DltD [Escherichia coli]